MDTNIVILNNRPIRNALKHNVIGDISTTQFLVMQNQIISAAQNFRRNNMMENMTASVTVTFKTVVQALLTKMPLKKLLHFLYKALTNKIAQHFLGTQCEENT